MAIFSIVIIMVSIATRSSARTPNEYLADLKVGVSYELEADLKNKPDLAVQVLQQCAAESELMTRRNCVILAQSLSAEALIEPLKVYLHDSNPKVRIDASQALRLIAGKKAIPWIAPLADDADATTRSSVLSDLAIVGDKSVHDILRKKLNDEDAGVRLNAASLLLYDGEKVPRAVVIAEIESSTVAVRRKAILLVGFLGNSSDSAMLDEIAHRGKDRARAEALEAGRQLQVTLASPGERLRILENSLSESQFKRWAASEIIRRYKLGEKEMRDVAKRAAANRASVGAKEAENALSAIDEMH